jgi:carboxypeptidase Taq
MANKEKFETLREKLKELHNLSGLINLAVWDQQVYLPEGGAAGRGEQVGFLAKLRHEKANDPALFELVNELSGSSDLTSEQRTVVSETLYDLTRERKKPSALVQAMADAEVTTHTLWLEARKNKDFSVVRDKLQAFLKLKQEYAQAVSPELSTYDALLDDFERGARSKDILERFSKIKTAVISLLADHLPDPQTIPRLIQLPVKIDRQMEFFTKLATKIGFDFQRGRLDKTVHPFMAAAGSSDIRLTARCKDEDLFYGLFGFLHEMGHGLYEQGLNPQWTGTPLAEACSLTVHESQSILFEKQLGYSKEFQTFLLSELQNQFPNDTRKYTAEALYKNWNTPRLSLQRLESGELGYALHIILRTELESEMLSGNLQLKDLPSAWSQKCKEYFNTEPADDLEGCLQDVHWYSGLWGYFPNYLGGAMYAAQLMDSFKKSEKTEVTSEEGIKTLLNWLRINLHSKGRLQTADKLIETITGSKLQPDAYLNYLAKSVQ